jgi:hypothetical protein
LLAAILSRRGLVVVVHGTDVPEGVFRAGMVNEWWTVSLATNPPSERLKVDRCIDADKIVFEVVM